MNIDEKIFDDITNLETHFREKNRDKYRIFLVKLELDLLEYYVKIKHKHSIEKSLIKYYEKLWEI